MDTFGKLSGRTTGRLADRHTRPGTARKSCPAAGVWRVRAEDREGRSQARTDRVGDRSCIVRAGRKPGRQGEARCAWQRLLQESMNRWACPILPEGPTTPLGESSAGSFAFLDVRYPKTGFPGLPAGFARLKGSPPTRSPRPRRRTNRRHQEETRAVPLFSNRQRPHQAPLSIGRLKKSAGGFLTNRPAFGN